MLILILCYNYFTCFFLFQAELIIVLSGTFVDYSFSHALQAAQMAGLVKVCILYCFALGLYTNIAECNPLSSIKYHLVENNIFKFSEHLFYILLCRIQSRTFQEMKSCSSCTYTKYSVVNFVLYFVPI